MKCCQAQKRLIQEAEGALSQRDSEALRLHLLSCEACRREMDELREVTSLFRAAKTPACEPDSQLWSRLESVIQQESAGREKLLRKSWLPNRKPSLGFGTAGAAAVLVVVAYVAAIQPGGDPIT
ncbi:MAG: zf-HC2 domain-containing protein, partial [Armatimonadota bacterium]